MKINRIYIKNFGGISNKEYVLSNGLNVIFGNNESGKSTFLSFIRFIFYGAKKQRGKELSFRDKYTPWNGEDMSGEVVFALNGNEYSLSRTVSASGRKSQTSLFNKSTGEQVLLTSDEVGCEIFGMSEQAFLKTMFIASEGTKIDSDGEILSKISNISQSGDEGTSYQFIKKRLDDMIADLSAPRRSKAVIPCLEKDIMAITNEKEQLTHMCEKHDELLSQLKEISQKLDDALTEKSRLNKIKAEAQRYNDYIAYKKCKENLENASADILDKTQAHSDEDSKYDAVKNISSQEEEIILKDNSDSKATDRMQEVLLKDKADSAKNRCFIFGAVSIVAAIATPFIPLCAIAAVTAILLTAYSFISFKKLKTQLSDISQRLMHYDAAKKAILEKYGLESSEHYLELKRQFAELLAKEEILKSKSDMAKRIYEERKSEFDILLKTLTEKYGNPDDIICSPVAESEDMISDKMYSADQLILNLTAEKAKILSLTESTENCSLQINALDAQIYDLNLKKAEAEEKLRILNLAADILNKSYEELKENFAPKLARTTADIFNSLTGGKYGEIIVNDQFEIQIKNDATYKNSNYFSSGTIQQLYFSLRLGIIELLVGSFPLFIDDAFITYDDERFNNAADFLCNYAEHNQIIFSTCHKRESNMNGAQVSQI